MRFNNKSLMCASVVALALSGCGGGKPSIPHPESSPTVSPDAIGSVSPGPSPAKNLITSALLAPGEIVGGTYSAIAPQNSPATQLTSSLSDCAEVKAPDPNSTAQGVYQSGVTGPFLSETISVLATPEATRLVEGLKHANKSCGRFGSELGGGIQLNVAIDQLTIPRIGDDMAAFRLTATVPGQGAIVYAHLVNVRSGNVVVMIALMAVTAPDAGTTSAIARAAVAKADKSLRHA